MKAGSAEAAEYPIALVKFSTKINKFDENRLTKKP